MVGSVNFMVEGMKVAKDFYNDSRAIVEKLMKMDDLTPSERNKACCLLMHDPPLVHLFWGVPG